MKNTLFIKIGKDWAIYHIFPVISLHPSPHFGILTDVEIFPQ